MKMLDFTVSHLLSQTRKKNANPGGGALISLIGNLAINLLLMMDRKDYKENNSKAKESKEKLLAISKKLEVIMQDDIDKVDIFIKALKDKENQDIIKKKNLDLIDPPRQTIDLLLQAMEISKFFLKEGRLETISDGEIANRLMKEAVFSSIINIEINLAYVDYEFDKEKITKEVEKLYMENEKIIEGRKKWN